MATSVAAAEIAVDAGADRVELCDNAAEGGTTPSAGTITRVCLLAGERGVPVFVMIRPRGGDFVYSDAEFAVMLADIDHAVGLGASGLVTGVLLADGSVDVSRTQQLVARAQGLPVTFHRAVDVSADPVASARAAAQAGCARVLSSGGAPTAELGVDLLRELVALESIGVVAAGSITETNAATIVQDTGVCEVHAALRTSSDGGLGSPDDPTLGSPVDWGPNAWPVPDGPRVARMRQALGGN